MSKYHNKKTMIDNITFDSIRESQRYLELKILLKAGKIKDLKLQHVYELQAAFTDNQGKKHRPITYIADFVYDDLENPVFRIVEDVKGIRTEAYKLKKKLFLHKYKNVCFFEI